MPSTIFWPNDVKQNGFCYGWTTPAVCVAGTLQADSEHDALQKLQSLRHSPRWEELVKLCGSEPVVLGLCSFVLKERTWEPSIRISVPSIPTSDHTIIFYYRHRYNTLRFYTLDVLNLDATNRLDVAIGSSYYASAQHDFTVPKKPQVSSAINETVINQFNSAQTLDDMLHHFHPERRSRLLTSASISCLRLFHGPIGFISYMLTIICNVRLIPYYGSFLLKDISATIQQIDVRAEQAEFFITEPEALHRRGTTHISMHSAQYTNFFNTLWLILNDITIGSAFGSFLCENNMILAQILNQAVEEVLINWVQWVLTWLDSWPAGLKLNTELSQFYSQSFIGLVAAWGEVLSRMTTYSPVFIYFIGTVSCGGVTLAISVIMDLLAVLTIHIYICYVISGAVYQRMLKTAGSLWNLFRGKRYNVLRNRTDSWEYDLDQLIFGTILFTLLAFLFPTVLVYYALFAIMRFGTLILQASLETSLAFLNHFPLFALMLRVKDPWRLPGGIYFSVKTLPGLHHPRLIIKNQPVPLSSIFYQYIQLLSRLAAHYNPLRLLRHIFTGQYLAAIPRYSIRYNKIPSDIDNSHPKQSNVE